VFPARPAHRQAVLAVMGHPDRAGAATRMRSPDDGGELAVRGVVVPLNGCPDWTSQRALMLLDQSGMDVYLFRLTAVFSLLACGSGLTGLWLMRRWFDRRVASPLRGLADGLKRGEKSLERVRPPGLTRWHETAAVSEQVEGLLGALAEREARIEQMEFETERQMREKEAGFTQQLRRAKDRAKIDPLTGLGNRGYLCEKIDLVFKQQAEAGEDLAAVMLDVDNFKPYNDTYGHQAGDGVLKFVGALLRGGLRPTDHAIRYGGDEFLLLLPDTGAQSAKVTVERLLKLFRQYTSRLNHSHKLSLSAGVASVVDDRATSGQALIAKADEALYAAKRHGKDKVERHTSSDPLPGYAIETG
jgi:diguanylate cyclase (GGDEF)-like protein